MQMPCLGIISWISFYLKLYQHRETILTYPTLLQIQHRPPVMCHTYMVFGIRAASGTSDASSSRRQRKIEEKYRWRKHRFFVPHQTPIPATQFLFSRSCYYLYVVYTYLSVSILCVSYRCCDTYALYIIKEAVIGYYIKMNTKHNRDVGNHTQKKC